MKEFKTKIIFVDWYDVSTQSSAWRYIKADHPLYECTKELFGKIIANSENRAEMYNWMRGCKSTIQMVLEHCKDGTEEQAREIIKIETEMYMAQLEYNVELFNFLAEMKKEGHTIVMATDNVDYFSGLVHKFERYDLFSHIINSADVKALKAEDPQGFFGACLKKFRMTFKDAILIDDNPKNIRSFAGAGGTGLLYKYPTDDIGRLKSSLKRVLTY